LNETWFVYILTNKPRGVLYVGSTNDLVRRFWQHDAGERSRFAHRYGLDRLVWFESWSDMAGARQRE
jgi:putative endonuclease